MALHSRPNSCGFLHVLARHVPWGICQRTAGDRRRRIGLPRLTATLTVRVPATIPNARHLLGDEEDGDRRNALRCLLGSDRSALETRDRGPSVVLRDGVIEVTDQGRVDLARAESTWVGIFELTLDEDDTWDLRLASPTGLSKAKWDFVSIAAPTGWLSSPAPLSTLKYTDAEVRWDKPASRGSALTTWRRRSASWTSPTRPPTGSPSNPSRATAPPCTRKQ